MGIAIDDCCRLVVEVYVHVNKRKMSELARTTQLHSLRSFTQDFQHNDVLKQS